MTDTHAHDDVIARLEALGEELDIDVDDRQLVDDVLARVTDRPNQADAPRRADRPRRLWLAAAAVAALATGIVAHPSGREAMARWFGLDGVTVEVDPAVSVLPFDEPHDEPFAVPGPGESEVVMVDGREVLFSAVDGRLSEVGITKTVRSSDQIAEVRVGDHPGLWIADGRHQVSYESSVGDVVVTRVAAHTLLWQDGPVLFRVEGFDDLADALEFATGT